MNQLDLLSSIYASYNSLAGHEYLLKLKSLMAAYRKRYTREGINFNVIYFLHAKMIELRREAFSRYPSLTHGLAPASAPETGHPAAPAEEYDAPYKWVTFRRHGSFFITLYDRLSVIDWDEAVIEDMDGDRLVIRHGGGLHGVRDMFPNARRKEEDRPAFFILAGRGGETRCYAADRVGKRMLAKRDFVKTRLKPFQSRVSPGSIRIFGENHIFIA
jgi:hypothetical protein